MAQGQDQTGKTARVIDLHKAKYKALVLDAFNKLERKKKREQAEHRSEVERKARNRW